MYGGIGGEVLYMPENKHWALGIDAYWVKQREFDQKFSFQDYQTVTGFVSFYYDLPFYDMRFKGRRGKFLGKDTGVNIDLSRRFKTGARVGAMASLTNCDAACVGEGSFNKWIYFTLPMDLFIHKLNNPWQSRICMEPINQRCRTQKLSREFVWFDDKCT